MQLDAVILAELARRVDRIGSIEMFPDMGSSIAYPDGAEYLRTGVAKAAASYPVAAGVQHLQVFGSQATSGVNAAPTDLCTDGAGNWLMCYGSVTNVLKSSDNGATWSTLTHSLGVNAVSCTYAAGKWVISGNSTTQLLAQYRTDLSGNFSTTSLSQAITTGVADTAMVRGDGTSFVATCAAASGNNIGYSTNATAWTAVAGGKQTRPFLSHNGAGKWIIGTYNDGTVYTSSNGALGTWGTATSPYGIGSSVACFGGGGLFVLSDANSVLQTFNGVSTWAIRSQPSNAGQGVTRGNDRAPGYFDGANYVMLSTYGESVWETADFVNWRRRWLAVSANQALAGSGNKLVAAGIVDKTLPDTCYATDKTQVTYVGVGRLFSDDGGNAGQGYLVSYVRIK